MAKELQKTLKLENEEYNINAVRSDTADKTQASLIIKESGVLQNGNGDTGFNGSTQRDIDYVNATKGGTFANPIYLSNPTEAPRDDEVITSKQINNRIVNLTGAPLCVWNTSFNPSDMTKNLYALKESSDKVHNFTVITGTEDDLYMLQDAINGDYATISQVTNYSIVSSSDHGLGIKTGTLDSSVSGVVKVPGRYAGTYDGENKNNWLVRTISNSTFKGNTKITGVIIEEAEVISGAVIKTIEAQAFSGCSSLKFVTVPNSVTAINDSTFEGCSKLKKIILGASTKTIGSKAFKDCASLTSIVIPKSVTSLASDAFANCINLKTVYYAGSESNWNAINISTGNDQIKNAQKVYNSTASNQTSPSTPSAQVDISAISNSPILYICEDDESITIPASNKIFLRLPGDNNFTEVSKGAARLESPTGATTQGYYTYETLAAIIAGINVRLDGLGVKALPTTLPETESVIIPENLHTEVLADDFDPESVPTVEQLTAAVLQLNGNTWDMSETTANNLKAVLNDTDKDSLKAIRADLTELAKEVEYDLGGAEDLLGTAIDYEHTRIDNLVETDTLKNIKDGYVTNTVGGISAGSTLSSQLTNTNDLEDLIKKLLGIKIGKAPSGLSVTLYYADGADKDKQLPSSLTAALNANAINVYATWSLSAGTYDGEYTPSVSSLSNATASTDIDSTTSTSGTIEGITITLAGAHVSASVKCKISFNKVSDDIPGSYLEASDAITINRTCYFGPDNGTLDSTNRTSKSNWTVTSSALNNKYFVILYPKAWGPLTSITDNDTQYEALSSTFAGTPETVTKNGGEYYKYKTINKQNGAMNFTINS
jgi:hypothetical protein